MGTLENPLVHCHTIRDLLKKIRTIHSEIVDHENTVPKCEICWQNHNEFNSIKGQIFLIVQGSITSKADEVCPNFEYIQLESVVHRETNEQQFQPIENVKEETEIHSSVVDIDKIDGDDVDNDWTSEESTPEPSADLIEQVDVPKRKTKKEKVACHFCYKTFYQGKRLAEHIARHTGDKPFQCKVCNKAFKSWDYYTLHCKNHEMNPNERKSSKDQLHHNKKVFLRENSENAQLDLKPFECALCGQGFSKKPQITLHILQHMRSRSINTGGTFECKICHTKFYSKKSLRKHLKNHEKDQYASSHENGESSYHCEICKRYFRNSGTLQRHIELRDSYNLSCNVCSEKICLTTDLYTHEKLYHKVKTPFQCLHCQEQFSNFKLIYKHHKLKHPNLLGPTKPFLCEICGLTMADSRDLKRHMMIHRGLKPHKCDLCDKTFRLQTEVEQHRRVHIPISQLRELYKCDMCPKKFRMKLTLWRHKRIHTGQVTEMFCPVCRRRFINSKNLEIHMLKHSNEAPRPFKCDICGKFFKIRKEYNIHMKRKHEIFSLEKTRIKKKT